MLPPSPSTPSLSRFNASPFRHWITKSHSPFITKSNHPASASDIKPASYQQDLITTTPSQPIKTQRNPSNTSSIHPVKQVPLTNRLRSTIVSVPDPVSPWSRAGQGSNPSTSISLPKALEYGYGDPGRIERTGIGIRTYDVELPYSIKVSLLLFGGFQVCVFVGWSWEGGGYVLMI